MEGKMQVMIGSTDPAIWQRFSNIPESKDLSLVRFQSIEQACNGLAQENVLLIFCEHQLIDGTYEDLLAAAKSARSHARVVVTGLGPNQFDRLGYCRARELGAFDVLRESYGIKDLEWVVICAMRDEAEARAVTASHRQNQVEWQSDSADNGGLPLSQTESDFRGALN
jgi:DNA-binding NtrC family response regulator